MNALPTGSQESDQKNTIHASTISRFVTLHALVGIIFRLVRLWRQQVDRRQTDDKNDACCEVIFGTRFPHFDCLLRVYYCRLACRGSRVSRSGSAPCTDSSALDRHRAGDSPIWLEQVGGVAVLLLLATFNDPYMVISAWLGANCLREFFIDRNRNDWDCWAGLNGGNCYGSA